MPLVNSRLSVAANAVSPNIMAGQQFEFLPYAARVELGLLAAAVGLNASVSTGNDILMSDQEVGAGNRMPIYPDDFTLVDVVRPGERIVVTFRNTTGAAIISFASVRIIPL